MREVSEERDDTNRRRTGKWIAQHAACLVDGLRFERASGTTSAERWKVYAVVAEVTDMPDLSDLSDVSVMSVLSVPFPDMEKSVDEMCEVEL
jgi:hypothetical protein